MEENICKKAHPWTDEQGRFNSYLCMIDWKKCDYSCKKHNPPLNPLIEKFVTCLNKNLCEV